MSLKSSLLFGDVTDDVENLRNQEGLDENDLEKLLSLNDNDEDKASKISNWSNTKTLNSTARKLQDSCNLPKNLDPKNDILYQYRMKKKLENEKKFGANVASGDHAVDPNQQKTQNQIFQPSPMTKMMYQKNSENLTQMNLMAQNFANFKNLGKLLEEQESLQLSSTPQAANPTPNSQSEPQKIPTPDPPKIQKIVLKDTESQTEKKAKRNVCIQHTSRPKAFNFGAQVKPKSNEISTQTEALQIERQEKFQNLQIAPFQVDTFEIESKPEDNFEAAENSSDITKISDTQERDAYNLVTDPTFSSPCPHCHNVINEKIIKSCREQYVEPEMLDFYKNQDCKKITDLPPRLNLSNLTYDGSRVDTTYSEMVLGEHEKSTGGMAKPAGPVIDKNDLTPVKIPEKFENDPILKYLNKKQLAVIQSIEELDKFIAETADLV